MAINQFTIKPLKSHPRFLHGESVHMNNTPEYQAYIHSRQRCNNPKNRNYPNYGGRGIEFRFESYQKFLEHLGRRPSPKHSLDRIDVNGHYEEGNVRWASSTTQARNKRNNRIIIAFGESLCVNEWSTRTGFTREAIRNRIDRHGWCNECALTIQPRQGRCTHRDGFEFYSPEWERRRNRPSHTSRSKKDANP